ncbi:cation transporter [Sulfuracidifex metallicus]|uniref:cation transporter n=1 Tax=Sulfuracidifex metallicus TaxID=47303 RepID=UPI0012ED41DB|nr:cation transporter [Sulfuracidifex metallicus]
MISLKGLNSASRIFLFMGAFLLPLSLVEFVFGSWYGSFILIADSYHGLLILSQRFFYSIVLRIVYKRSKRFPYGKYNLESLGILLASIIVLFLSLDLIISVVKGTGGSQIPGWLAIFTWLPAIATFFIFLAERKYSWISLVRSDIAHSKLDISTELVSGFMLLLNNYFATLGIVLVIVGFVTLDTARELKEAVLSLMGASIDTPLRKQVVDKVKKLNVKVLSASIRKVGSFYSVSLVIGLPSSMTLKEAYKIRKKVYKIVNSLDNIANVEIKIVPLRRSVFLSNRQIVSA